MTTSYIKIVHQGMCGPDYCTCGRGFGVMWDWDGGVAGRFKKIDNSWRSEQSNSEEYALFLRLKRKYGE